MKVQSLSIVVPTGRCWNDCPYCVSKQHCEKYSKDIISINPLVIPQSYMNRVRYAREEGCNSMILTGTAEPQQNLPFIYKLLSLNKELINPFYNITIQTTGSGFFEEDIKSMAAAGITTLALSLSSTDSYTHWEITNTPMNLRKSSIETLIQAAKDNNMNIRACFNLTDEYNYMNPEDYFEWCSKYNIDQATFRKIYSNGDTPQARWCEAHKFDSQKWLDIQSYIKKTGIPVSVLPYGFIQYDVKGISTVIDNDCMSKNDITNIRYFILRPNGKLYSSWDLKGSLIF